jgi:hypothetical protein
MAINTQGHQVRQMPQYSAVNPSLVAFNPTAISDGMLQAFQIAKQYEALKASKALQAELEATRSGRIASTNKGYDVNIAAGDKTLRQMPRVEEIEGLGFDAKAKTIMPEADFRLLQMEQQGRAMPRITDQAISNADFNIAGNTARVGNLPTIADAEKQAALAQTATSQNTISLAPQQRATDEAKLKFGATTADLGNIMAPMGAQLEAFRLGDQMGHAGEDAARKRASQDIDILLKNSQIPENLARAEYYAKGGASSGGAAPNYANQIAALERAQQMVEAREYTGPDGEKVKGLAAYKGAVYDDKGGLRKSFWGGAPFRKDPEAEKAIVQSRQISEAISRLIPLLAGGDPAAAAPGIPGTIAPVPATSVGTRKTVIQNGKKYTIEFNGQSWVEAK